MQDIYWYTCFEYISILVLRNSRLSPRDASYKIFNRNLLTSRDDSALWDNGEDCEESDGSWKGSKECQHFSEVIKLGCVTRTRVRIRLT